MPFYSVYLHTMRFAATLTFILLLSGLVSAQETIKDTVYLNDGSYIEGLVLNPGSEGSIQVQTEDGAILFLQNARVLKIALHAPRPPKETQGQDRYQYGNQVSKPSFFKIDAGSAFPIGEMAGSNSYYAGFAKPGFMASLHVWRPVSASSFWNINLAYTTLPVKEEAQKSVFQEYFQQQQGSSVRITEFSAGRWNSLKLGVGFTFKVKLHDELQAYIQPEIGIIRLVSPEYDITLENSVTEQGYVFPSYVGRGIFTSLNAGLIYKNRFTFQLGGMRSRANIQIPVGSSGQTQSVVQPFSAITASVGFFFKQLY